MAPGSPLVTVKKISIVSKWRLPCVVALCHCWCKEKVPNSMHRILCMGQNNLFLFDSTRPL